MPIEYATDLHVVAHQPRVMQWITDVLHITYANPTEP